MISGTAAAAPPGPDPRLEAALSTNILSQVERSVQFQRTLPQPEKPRKPSVDEGAMQRVQEDVYIDRRLVPQPVGPADEGAVRIYRRDAR
jgi:hypothetical protein